MPISVSGEIESIVTGLPDGCEFNGDHVISRLSRQNKKFVYSRTAGACIKDLSGIKRIGVINGKTVWKRTGGN